MRKIYAAVVVFGDTYLKSKSEIIENNCAVFNDFNFMIKICNVNNNYIQFEFYDECFQYFKDEKLHKHFVGRFGISMNCPFYFQNCFLFNGEATGVFMNCYLLFSQNPIDIDRYNKMIGLELIDGRLINLDTIKNQFTIKNRIDEFMEMLDYCDNDNKIFRLTKQLISNTRLYGENFISRKSPKIPEKDGIVSFEENLTLSVVKRFIGTNKKVAVLNFANPVEPGGGVLRGANAQEEYLCRSTNLYKSLISKNAEKYYAYNKSIRSANQFNSMFIGTDEVIYSPNVTVLKKADGYGIHSISGYKEIYEDQYYDIDVLTCAAPFFSGSGYIIPNGDLKYILMRRIRNIFEVAIENDVDILVLGAFGCGAFHNPPEVVADAFRECLLELRYLNAFDEVVFAVKREAIPSKNIEMFERAFSAFPKYNEDGYERYIQKHLQR